MQKTNRETQNVKSATPNKNMEVCNLKLETGNLEYNI